MQHPPRPTPDAIDALIARWPATSGAESASYQPCELGAHPFERAIIHQEPDGRGSRLIGGHAW